MKCVCACGGRGGGWGGARLALRDSKPRPQFP